MIISILGAGNVGEALAGAWIRAGHKIKFGVRDAAGAKTAALLSRLGPAASAHASADAVAGADAVVLAVPWNAARDALAACGSLAGKIIIDATNPLLPNLAGLEVGHTASGAERIASWAPGASVFKCFNQTGAGNLGGAEAYKSPLAMFVAGDDAAKKPVVMRLAADAGFDAIDAGPLASARMLEPLAMLWIHLAVKMGRGPGFGFAVASR